MKKTIDIKTGFMFPWHFQFLGFLGFCFSVPLVIEKPIPGILLCLGSLFLLSGYSGIEINKVEKVYREYFAFLFFKAGKKIKYACVDKIFINTSKISQQVHTAHTSHSSSFSNVEYNGYLKFEDGAKLHLLTKRKKVKLLTSLTRVSDFLNTRIDDNTPNS